MREEKKILSKAIAPELEPVLDRLVRAQAEYGDLAAEAYYADGFRTGARLMLDILDGGGENLGPVSASE